MSREQLEYESEWSRCRRCQCRRPLRELQSESGALVCVDRGWCDRMLLFIEEQKEVAAQASRSKTRRPKRK